MKKQEELKQFDSKKILTVITIFMMLLLSIKLIEVWYFTSRGVGLGFPYNAMLYDPFHRFTDWLIPIEWSKQINPYDMTNDLYNHIPPSPYSIFSFWLLSATKFVNPHAYFIGLIIIFIVLNYLIFRKVIDTDKYNSAHLYLSMIIGFYPLYFLIDRGNSDIFTFIFISAAIYTLFFNKKSLLFAIFIALVISLKPSSGLFIFLLIFMNKKHALYALIIILTVYMWPIVFLDNSFSYFIPLVEKALTLISGQTTFTHNILSGARALNVGEINKFIIPLSGLVVILFSFVRLYLSSIKFKMEFALAQIIIVSLLINDPDPDYRLTLLLPLLMITLEMLKDVSTRSSLLGNKVKYILFILSFIILFSFTNIDIPGHIPYYTIAKVMALLYLLYVYCFALYSGNVTNLIVQENND